jgi:hypothetical protein
VNRRPTPAGLTRKRDSYTKLCPTWDKVLSCRICAFASFVVTSRRDRRVIRDLDSTPHPVPFPGRGGEGIFLCVSTPLRFKSASMNSISFLLKNQSITFCRDFDFIAPPSRTLRRDKPGLNGLARARSLGLAAFVPQSGTNGAPALANCCPSEGLLLRNSQTFRQWAPSCPFSRPRGLCPAARDKSFSPFPKRLKSQAAQVAFEQAQGKRISSFRPSRARFTVAVSGRTG